MEPLKLPSLPDLYYHNIPQLSKSENTIQRCAKIETEDVQKSRSTSKGLNQEPGENLTMKGCIIRIACVMLLPITEAFDWNYGTYTQVFIIPVILYLEITAFAANCPVKRLFSNYFHSNKAKAE